MNEILRELVKKYFKTKSYNKIIELKNKNIEDFENDEILLESLCLSYFALGDGDNTENYCIKLLKLNKKHIGANYFLAKIYRQRDIDLSIEYYKKAVNLSDFSIQYAKEYANFLSSLSLNEESIDILKKLIKKYPNETSLEIDLAKSFENNGDFEKSEKILKKFLSMDIFQNKMHALCNLLATTYYNANKFELAKEYYKKSYELNPENSEAILNHAVLLQTLGDFKEAEIILNKLISIKPSGEAFRLISLGRAFKSIDEDQVKKMLLFSKNKLTNNEETSLNFALGKVYEDIKDYKNSALHYKKGNSLKRSIFSGYNIQDEINIFNDLNQIFNENLFNKFKGVCSTGSGNIFIVGMPRSGTTLLEQILSSHKDIFGAGELNIITESVDKILKTFSIKNFKEKIKNLQEEEVLNISNNIKNTFKKNFNVKAKYIIDKNPLNFRNLGIIKLCLPEAKIIHIKRDQNDNCLSIYKNFFFLNVMPWSYDLNELKQYYLAYNNYMKIFKNKIKDNLIEINYEDLISNSNDETRKILNFLNLDWDPNCEKFYENKRVVKTASFNKVRKGIYKTSNKKWLEYKKYFKELFV